MDFTIEPSGSETAKPAWNSNLRWVAAWRMLSRCSLQSCQESRDLDECWAAQKQTLVNDSKWPGLCENAPTC